MFRNPSPRKNPKTDPAEKAAIQGTLDYVAGLISRDTTLAIAAQGIPDDLDTPIYQATVYTAVYRYWPEFFPFALTAILIDLIIIPVVFIELLVLWQMRRYSADMSEYDHVSAGDLVRAKKVLDKLQPTMTDSSSPQPPSGPWSSLKGWLVSNSHWISSAPETVLARSVTSKNLVGSDNAERESVLRKV